eukprot:1159139-Pelagomonas_calceolata.AAC.5
MQVRHRHLQSNPLHTGRCFDTARVCTEGPVEITLFHHPQAAGNAAHYLYITPTFKVQNLIRYLHCEAHPSRYGAFKHTYARAHTHTCTHAQTHAHTHTPVTGSSAAGRRGCSCWQKGAVPTH